MMGCRRAQLLLRHAPLALRRRFCCSAGRCIDQGLALQALQSAPPPHREQHKVRNIVQGDAVSGGVRAAGAHAVGPAAAVAGVPVGCCTCEGHAAKSCM